MVEKVKLGIIGFSEANGHPYSFSAIINGYDREGMQKSGWKGIFDYLEAKDESDFLQEMAVVTHIWTQDYDESLLISNAVKIEHVCREMQEMIGSVDGVIIARDDYEKHFELAKPFLEAGIKVFIDKPLSLDLEELKYFQPYLQGAQLMSCSGLRYARELDTLRNTIKQDATLKLIRGSVLNSWEKYGIHMLDAIFGLIDFDVKSVVAFEEKYKSVVIKTQSGVLIQIDALGLTVKTFEISTWSETSKEHIEINDNFTAFKRTMYYFIKMIRTNEVQINSELTLLIMKVLIAANISIEENREVYLDEISI